MSDNNLAPSADANRSEKLDSWVKELLKDQVRIDLPVALLKNMHEAVEASFMLALGTNLAERMGDDARQLLLRAHEANDQATIGQVIENHLPNLDALIEFCWEDVFVKQFAIDQRALAVLFADL